MTDGFEMTGQNASALFTLKLHRGDGMVLLAMNWREDKPSDDFVGFAIEYKAPNSDTFIPLSNRLGFANAGGQIDPEALSTRLSPIQKFRWVHFPHDAELAGEFVYRVTPVFMDNADKLSYGEFQEVSVELSREIYPGLLNVGFTRGFVSSQAFVNRYESAGDISTLLPEKADDGLSFVPTHPKTEEALAWMGFEARRLILDVLDKAIADTEAQVRMVAYDLNDPAIVTRLEKLGQRLKIIIDDSGSHGRNGSAEDLAETRLVASAGRDHVLRQHMLGLQHNKTIVADGPTVKTVVCGSTNFSWRGLYVQSNNVLTMHGENAIKPFQEAFEYYWTQAPKTFGDGPFAEWIDLQLDGIDGQVTFSPHSSSNARLDRIADDIGSNTTSSLFYSLAFLYQTTGPILDAILKVSKDDNLFVYGISDRKVGGIDLQKPGGNVSPVFPSALTKNVPPPFSKEPTGGGGIRMHHKFVVIDFDKPTARVYLGSYNFSSSADIKNGENLLLIRDRQVSVAYVVAALTLFDHYHFRIVQQDARKARKELELAKPPRAAGEEPWWAEDYADPQKIRDRELFA